MAPLLALLVILLGWLPSATRAKGDIPERPDCVDPCTSQYFHDTDGTADCDSDDNPCVCKDPVFPHAVSCCLVDECNDDDLDKAAYYVHWICAAYDIQLPNLNTCVPESKTSSTTTSSTTSSTQKSSSTDSKTGVSSTSVATTETSDAASASPSASASATSSQDKPKETAASPAGGASTPTTTQSSSSTADTGNGPDTFAIGLGVGLGVGIPLTICAIGLLAFLFWRARRNQRVHHPRSPSPPVTSVSATLPTRPGGDDFDTASFTRSTVAGSGREGRGSSVMREFDKRWHPLWASDLMPPPRRQRAEPAVHELAS